MTRVEAVFDDWLRSVQTSPEALAAQRVVLERFVRDDAFSSDVFEPSVTSVDGVVQSARFSYALPAFGERPGETARWATTFARCFGSDVERTFANVLRGSRRECVEQILVGAVLAGAGEWVAKLYVQFHDGQRQETSEFVRTFLGLPEISSPRGDLHLLGIDVGPGGVKLVKLYFLMPVVERPKASGTTPEIDCLFDAAGGRLQNVLFIHRLRPGAPAKTFEQPSDIDLHIGENGLRWEELARAQAFAGHARLVAEQARLGREHDFVVRRLSLSVGESRRVTLYGALRGDDDIDPAITSSCARRD